MVVIFMYGVGKTLFPKMSSIILVTTILIYSIGVEVLQLLQFPHLFGVEKTWVKILLGSHFSFSDILAYFLGVVFIYWLDRNYIIPKKVALNQ